MGEVIAITALALVLVLWFRVRHNQQIADRRRNRSSREW